LTAARTKTIWSAASSTPLAVPQAEFHTVRPFTNPPRKKSEEVLGKNTDHNVDFGDRNLLEQKDVAKVVNPAGGVALGEHFGRNCALPVTLERVVCNPHSLDGDSASLHFPNSRISKQSALVHLAALSQQPLYSTMTSLQYLCNGTSTSCCIQELKAVKLLSRQQIYVTLTLLT
jgi:hypothetical protein